MSEHIADVTKEGLNAAKDTLQTRFGGAFSAYVATTWIGFNWSNIALLFMSTVPVEQRMQAIYGQENLYWNFLIAPLIVGFILSIAVPAVNAFVSSITASFSAMSDTSHSRAKINMETRIARKQNTKATIENRTETIKKDLNDLVTKVTSYESQANELESKINSGQKALLTVALRTNKLINELEGLILFSEKDVSISHKQLLDLFTENERNDADFWRQEVITTLGYETANSLVESDLKSLLIDPEDVDKVIRDIRVKAVTDFGQKLMKKD